MKKLRINAVLENESEVEEQRADGKFTIKKRKQIQVGAVRGGAPADFDVKETDVVRVTLSDGFDLWLRADELYKEFGVKTSRGVADLNSDVWELNLQVAAGEDERGKIVKAIQALEIFDVDITGTTANKIAAWYENKQLIKQGPGLYRCPLLSEKFTLIPLADDEKVASDQPILLFIHGTASSSGGCYCALWDGENKEGKKAREDLFHVYGERVYAYEHCSLTKSPIANALDLLEKLPGNAQLHIVTHSRGGLIGELLCLGQRDRKDEYLTEARIDELFKKREDLSDLFGFLRSELQRDKDKKEQEDEYQKQRSALKTLLPKLDHIQVQRFVRIACPARGTTLASGRLDRWLSMLKHLSGDNPFIEEPIDFLLAVVKERTDPRSLPGLEAMMPGSPLIRLLNLPQIQVSSDLTVIAGDLEGRSIWGKLKTLALDWFYSGEHDLVVNTGSMYGGLKRPIGGARFYLDQGHDVNHFRYFTNDRTVKKLVSGLTRADMGVAGFNVIEEAKHAEPARAPTRPPSGPRPLAFVLPGIMGSHLKLEGNRIWLDLWDLALGRLEDINIKAADVFPDEVFEDYYSGLLEHLKRTHRVVAFPYDWRKSMLDNGNALARRMAEELAAVEATQQPVHIVAHSMGGLVARAMIAQHPDIWRRISALPGSRLLMLGTPNGGSHEIVRLLVGQADTLVKLALLDFAHDRSELLEIINNYPGVLELLPTTDGMSCYSSAYWRNLCKHSDGWWPLPKEENLHKARQAWEVLQNSPVDSERMLYVAGRARKTPMACEASYDDVMEHNYVRFFSSRQGDGKVLWETGRLPDVKTWYLDEVEHGDLAAHEAAFPAYLELLQTGGTSRLPKEPPAVVRAVSEEREVLEPAIPDCMPEGPDLAATVLGSGRGKRPLLKRRLPQTRVLIRHGSLQYAQHPVCVGHYKGDTIVSAEAYLDSTLNYRLSKRHQLDLYPGRLGTWKVFINPDQYAKPGGAIVIGLGQVGELNTGALEEAFRRALLDYALQVAEWPDDRFGATEGVPRSACITTLLIGTGFGSIGVRESIETILRAVMLANQRLFDAQLNDQVLIDEVEILELWEDVAIFAACELEKVLQDGELAEQFIWQPKKLQSGEGGRRRVHFEEAPNWWHRLEIIHDRKKEELRFIALTERARAEESLVSGQLRLAESFIRQAISRTDHDAEIARTLFEMLLPNRLKEMAPNQYDVVVVVDEVSARFPWELLEDRWSNRGKPLSVAAGMVRQLKTPAFRARPAYSAEDIAYIVGDPVVPPDPEGMLSFPSLPGARAEAEAVIDKLEKGGFLVEAEIQKDAERILRGLHANKYRVLHLAGHGVHKQLIPKEPQEPCPTCEQLVPEEDKYVSGMVIGQGVYLTPGDIEQMRWVPELVFINCCYLGSTNGDELRRYNRLAANIGAQFIKMGVKAVVAAGWAVNDAAAKTFAISFYDHLLNGDTFGDAVHAARDETFTRHGETNTWGAYQCYGDPAYTLRTFAKTKGEGRKRCYISPSQLVADLENIISRARMGHGRLSDIDEILQAVPEDLKSEWLKRSDVAAALGLAYGELGAFKEAINHLDHAIAENKSEFPVRILEQRANFNSRWAVELALTGQTLDENITPIDLIEKAIKDLQRLNEFAETVERWCLLGSAYKRMAWISKDEERSQALKSMSVYYRKGHVKAYDKEKGMPDPYPLLNWLTAAILRIFPLMLSDLGDISDRIDPGNPGDLSDIIDPSDIENEQQLQQRIIQEKPIKPVRLEEWCRMVEARAAEQEIDRPDFWNTLVKPDCDLVRALAEQTLKERKQEIIDGYRRAKKRAGSKREFSSVLEHLAFIEEILSGVIHKTKTTKKAKTKKKAAAKAKTGEVLEHKEPDTDKAKLQLEALQDIIKRLEMTIS